MSNKKVKQASELGITTEQPLWLAKFVDSYQQLSIDNLQLLAGIYHQDIVFIDPMHQLKGFDNLKNYFDNLYRQLSYCEFNIEQVITQADEAAIYWQMSYQHPQLNSGKMVSVQGSSHLKGVGDKVIYHRDYLDLGAMLYEQLPLLGRVIHWLKNRAVTE
jgi:hypothetical protein